MAFQQPQPRPQVPRQQNAPDLQIAASPARKRTLEESQEWILFSPAQNLDERSLSHTTQTPRTATHLSEFGSLETHVRSQPLASSQDTGGDGDNVNYQNADNHDDGAELDSLDDGLHAFHHPFSTSSNQLDHSGGAVLPTHDGFGTFPSSAGLQEQLWQFERYNPHRRSKHAHRRSSVQIQLDAMEEEKQEPSAEDERTARIEKWRLEQSRAVLEEIERETRRRRKRMSRMSGATSFMDDKSAIQTGSSVRSTSRHDSIMHGESAIAKDEEQPPSESFWRRITRRVIQDLIGLDETTLSVIFGEQLVDDPSPTPTQPSPIASAAARESRVTFNDSNNTWEVNLFRRIARELGIFVHQLSEHDGAFSTYKRALGEVEYAGLPINRAGPSLRQRRRNEQRQRAAGATQTDALFAPTVPQSLLSPTDHPADTSLWGIEEEPEQTAAQGEEAERVRQEREYWERDIDVKMVFSYLRGRFSRGAESHGNEDDLAPSAPPPHTGPLPASWMTAAPGGSTLAQHNSSESLRRAEVIRRQHPLVSRAAERAVAAAQNRRRDSLLRRHHMQTLMHKRPAGVSSSSCASQSTKRSRHSRSGSSRHYWDFGGSVGSVGSGPAMSSALGGWGEV